MRTLNCKLTDAEICRRNGWGPGTLLTGKELGTQAIIQITAVGMTWVLVVLVDEDGVIDRETCWTLSSRNWRVRK